MGTRCNIMVVPNENDRKNLPKFNPKLIHMPFIPSGHITKDERKDMDLNNLPGLGITSVPEGHAIRIYCQCDGYYDNGVGVAGVGKMLVAHYNTYEKAINLVLVGSLEGLVIGFHPCLYTRNQGKPHFDLPDKDDNDTVLGDAAYVYKFEDGKWYVNMNNERRSYLSSAGMVVTPETRWVPLETYGPLEHEMRLL